MRLCFSIYCVWWLKLQQNVEICGYLYLFQGINLNFCKKNPCIIPVVVLSYNVHNSVTMGWYPLRSLWSGGEAGGKTLA